MNHVYVVVNIASGEIVENKIFSTWAKADHFRSTFGVHSKLYTVDFITVDDY